MTQNFNVIKLYNNSDVYALSVGHLGDRIGGRRAIPRERGLQTIASFLANSASRCKNDWRNWAIRCAIFRAASTSICAMRSAWNRRN